MSSNSDLEQQVLVHISEGDVKGLEATLQQSNFTIQNYQQSDGTTLLHLAVVCGPASLINELLERGVNVNAQTMTDKATALHMAAASDRLSTVEALLTSPQIDDTIKDGADRTALDLAASKSIETAIRYARTQYIDKVLSCLRKAVLVGDSPSKIKSILATPRAMALVDVNTLDNKGGETILHAAVRSGKADLVKICLEIGANAYAKDRKGKLPIELTQNDEIRTLLKNAPMITTPELNVTNELARPQISGYLLKYANVATGYRRRFVVVEDGILIYYKNKADYPVNCRGSIHLQYAKLVNRDNFGFALRVGGQTLYFKAENAVDAARWRMVLSRYERTSHHGDASPAQADALMAARTLHTRSRATEGTFHNTDHNIKYEKTFHAAQDCLNQLETLMPNPKKESDNDQSEGSVPDPVVCRRLLSSLQEFFVLASQREQYWKTLLEAEIKRKKMMEETLNRIRQGRKIGVFDSREGQESISSSSATPSRDFGDEFYDALEEAEALAVLSLTEEEEVMEEKLFSDSTLPPPPVKGSPASSLSFGPLPEYHVPSEEVKFVETDLIGYPEDRRRTIPVDATKIPPISIWNIIKNAIGKDLTRIPIPVNFSEPISMLQRLAEDLEYADLLYLASMAEDPLLRLQYAAAFAVSPYSSTDGRISKPFNPLLGETFEYVSRDQAFRYISEQVSHHPPISACYCESARFIYYAEVSVKTKFWGKSLELVPDGLNHIILKTTGEHFSYRKVNTGVYNLILGKMWIDHFGTLKMVNHQTGEVVEIEFKPTGWRTTDAKRLQGIAYDANGTPKYEIEGYWHKYLQSRNVETGQVINLWRRKPLPPQSEKNYHFTSLTTTLNELASPLTKYLCPTDSRFRPDQRAMEEGYFEHANLVKVLLEEKQRATRRQWEADPTFQYCPRWFTRDVDADSGEPYWRYLGGYWEGRQVGKWENVVEIYLRPEELPTNPSPSLCASSTPSIMVSGSGSNNGSDETGLSSSSNNSSSHSSSPSSSSAMASVVTSNLSDSSKKSSSNNNNGTSSYL